MTLSDSQTKRLAENIAAIQSKIADAAIRSGRTASHVKLIAVTKYVDAEMTAAVASFCSDIAESRPQDLWEKRARLDQAVTTTLRWHMIGHLQRNKVRRTLPCVDLIHSVDSIRLLEELNEESLRQSRRTKILLEANVSGDVSKGGFAPSEIETALLQCAAMDGLQVRGLMAMSGLESDEATTRREFASLRELRDRLRTQTASTIQLDELSMGMSGDFEIAIEEGATLVRVGSALFEGVVSE